MSNYLENFTKEIDGELEEIKRTRDLAGKNRHVSPEDKKLTLNLWNNEIVEELGFLNQYYRTESYTVPGEAETVFELLLVKNNQLVATLHSGAHYDYGPTIHAVALDYKVFGNKENYCKSVEEALEFIAGRLKQVVIFEETGEILDED